MSKAGLLAEVAGPPLTGPPRTLRELLDQAVTAYPNNRAVISVYQHTSYLSEESSVDQGESLIWTYAQLDEKAEQLATSLSTRGIHSGMRIAAFVPNSAEWALLFWASIKLRTTFVPLDERALSRTEEVHHYLDVTKPSALFVSKATSAQILLKQNFSDISKISVKAITQGPPMQETGWEALGDLLSRQSIDPILIHQRKRHCPDINDIHEKTFDLSELDSTLYISFTSGTSGLPKACPMTHYNFWAAEAGVNQCNARDPTSRVAVCAPLSAAMGIFNTLRRFLGGATVIIPSPTFDAEMALEAIDKLECTHTNIVPAMLLALLNQPSFHPERTKSLKIVSIGGTVVPPHTLAAATDSKLLGASQAVAAFGMSEVIQVCNSASKTGTNLAGGAVCLGQTAPGVKTRICKPQSRCAVTRGEIGELHVGGDLVIEKYLYGDNSCFYDDQSGHWIATGDEAMMDEQGNIFILGRYKDIIIRGGENLSAALIENCLGIAGVSSQIIGVPDDIAGEVPLAIVQVPDRRHIPKAKIHDLVMEHLGPTCLPTGYITLAEIGMTSFPLTRSGKVIKRELKKAVIEYLSRQPLSEHSGFSSLSTTSTVETILSNIAAALIGQSESSIPRDQPISTILDSINVLRFQANIERHTAKKLPVDMLFGSATINTLAMKLDLASHADSPHIQIEKRLGPPTAGDMVHTHDNTACASRTRSYIDPLLAKFGMSWEDVDAVFPVPELSSGYFGAMRPMAFSIRLTYVIKAIEPSLLRIALEKTLEKWSMLRSFAVKFDTIGLFVITKACAAIFQATIVDLPQIEGPEEMYKLRFPELKDNNVHFGNGGLLARFAITQVKSTGSTALMILANHATFDAMSTQAFNSDLEANIHGGQIGAPYTDYKFFADIFYQYRHSIPAQNSVAYHVNRLRGIGSLRESAWPPQQCHGWFIGDDTGHHIPSALKNPLLQERSQIAGDDGFIGMIGVKKTANLTELVEMRSAHQISAPILFKAACSIVNSRLSGSSEVYFFNTQAGRSWPFLDENVAKYLPNPVTIAGNTLGLVMNRIQIHSSTTVGSLLTHLEEEQHLLTKHAHAPLTAICAQLNAADVATFQTGRRQLLNFNPTLAETAANQGKTDIEMIQIEGFTDVMLEWHCGMVGSLAKLDTQWDGAQFGKATVDEWADMFMVALEWVARTANWDRKLSELDLSTSAVG